MACSSHHIAHNDVASCILILLYTSMLVFLCSCLDKIENLPFRHPHAKPHAAFKVIKSWSASSILACRATIPYLCVYLSLIGHDSCQVVYRYLIAILEFELCRICSRSLHTGPGISCRVRGVWRSVKGILQSWQLHACNLLEITLLDGCNCSGAIMPLL